ncbi:hypothetical protein C8Q80DRAFT_513883 [Daedaleopsis nitida]|nr:hypothetical protein C8Q80DRAFT_513883 [Daedaleopsis nitida]
MLSSARHCVYPASPDGSKTVYVCDTPIEEHPAEAEDGDQAAMREIKHIVRHFIRGMSHRSMQGSQNPTLRAAIRDEIVSWSADGISPSYVDALIDTSCSMAENTYSHTSYDHQLIVARYNAYVVVADDLGEHCVEAMGQFAERFARGERQLHPVLDCMVNLLRTVHEYYLVHIMAAAEGKPVIHVLRQVVDEALDSVPQLEEIRAAHPGLDPCYCFVMGYVDFYYKPRGTVYRIWRSERRASP